MTDPHDLRFDIRLTLRLPCGLGAMSGHVIEFNDMVGLHCKGRDGMGATVLEWPTIVAGRPHLGEDANRQIITVSVSVGSIEDATCLIEDLAELVVEFWNNPQYSLLESPAT